MIQNRTQQDRTVEGNLTGENIKMGVADMGHILNILTDMYSDRELACIREYSTNAWDAHVEAGVTVPIEVSTPTALSPFLTIRDFGIGLTLKDIREIYSQYGASTKRQTNDQNGMLGIGCKAALTYADQFTVTSVKDGVRIQVVVARDTMGASMKVVDTSATTEANGTTVVIPARSGNMIETKARKFFSYWTPGRVKLNGVEPEFMPGAKWVIDGKIALVEGQYNEPNRVVMGGVAYPAPDLRTELGSYSKAVAFVDIGTLDFAPSREALMDTDTTKDTITKVEVEIEDAIKQSILDDIAAASSPRDAVQRRIDWGTKVPRHYIPASTPYKGQNVPDAYKVPDNTIYAPLHGRKMTSNSVMTEHMPIATALAGMWIEGWDHASFTATTKKKLVKYCEDNQLSVTGFMLSLDSPDPYWIEGIPTVKWETIKAIKLPRNAPNPRTGRIPGSYDLWEDGDWNEGIPADDIDQTNPVFWTFGKYYDGRVLAQWFHENFPGSTLVMLRSGREDKFQRLFPKARRAEEAVRESFEKWAAKVSDDTKLALAVQGDYRLADYDYLDASQITDPRFAKIVKLRKLDLSRVQDRISGWSKLGQFFDTDQHDMESPLDDYPLLPSGYTLSHMTDKDHLYRYMNCEYAYQQRQNGAAS